MNLSDSTAIVTGGSQGIGRAIAERYVKEGATVVITDIDGTKGEETAEQIRMQVRPFRRTRLRRRERGR
ncbi:MAG: SDR family NAD(P)-dependent oxidoreductase [Halobacteriales archaeon]|nr:SDR family NAD(P)-dependent oxidoreductase [Halobacteriales archaeon]